MRLLTTLVLMAVLAQSAIAGSYSGSGPPVPVSVVNGGTGASTTATAQANLGISGAPPQLHTTTTLNLTTSSASNWIIDSATAGANVTINLPAQTSGSVGKIFQFKKQGDVSKTIQIFPNGTETIDGAASTYLVYDNDTITLQTDSSPGATAAWRVLNFYVKPGATSNYLKSEGAYWRSGSVDFGAVTGQIDLVGQTAGVLPSTKGGTGGTVVGTATLVAGTVTVANTAVAANTIIVLSGQNSSGTHGELTVSARTVGTDFTITSSSVLDTRSIGYMFVQP